jgi:hypothetical protein
MQRRYIMTPDQAWNAVSFYDYLSALVIEFGLVVLVLVGVGLGIYNVRLYYRAGRRAYFKWRSARLEEK